MLFRSLGKPWVFDPEFELLSRDAQHSYKFRVIERHLDLIVEHMPERYALVQAKKHLAWYIAGVAGSAKGCAQVFTFEEMAPLRDWFRGFWNGAETRELALAAAEPLEISTDYT